MRARQRGVLDRDLGETGSLSGPVAQRGDPVMVSHTSPSQPTRALPGGHILRPRRGGFLRMASGKGMADVNEPCKEPAALSSAHKGLTRKGGKSRREVPVGSREDSGNLDKTTRKVLFCYSLWKVSYEEPLNECLFKLSVKGQKS